MREIKFRAWDKSAKRMQWPIQIWNDVNGMGGQEIRATYEDGEKTFYETCPPNPDVIEDYVLMQFTGLKDKNGKEIYEGDILKVVQRGKIITPMKFNKEPEWTDFYEKIVKVYYEPGMWLTEGSIIGHLVTVNAQARDSGGSIEVIGNIYENPDLLK